MTLSGGEQQRVALARALALAPPILLLDEPLSALDEKIRREMQTELKRIQKQTGTTFVYVTHDQEEALTMSDRIAVIDRGECVQCDTPRTLFRRPRTRFVAGFFRDCNLVEAECIGIDGERAAAARSGDAGRDRARGPATPDSATGPRSPSARNRLCSATGPSGARSSSTPAFSTSSIGAPASSMSASSRTASGWSPFRPARRYRPERVPSALGSIPRASCCWRTDLASSVRSARAIASRRPGTRPIPASRRA